jgi:hypothetical protein
VLECSCLARLGRAARDVRRVIRGWREEVLGRAERPRALGTKRLPRRGQPQNQLLPINFRHCQQGRGGCGIPPPARRPRGKPAYACAAGGAAARGPGRWAWARPHGVRDAACPISTG